MKKETDGSQSIELTSAVGKHHSSLVSDLPVLVLERDPFFKPETANLQFNLAKLNPEDGLPMRISERSLKDVRNHLFALFHSPRRRNITVVFDALSGAQFPSHVAFDRAIESFSLDQTDLLFGQAAALPQVNRNERAQRIVRIFKYPQDILEGIEPKRCGDFLGRLAPESVLTDSLLTQTLIHKLQAARLEVIPYKSKEAVRMDVSTMNRNCGNYQHSGD